MQRSKRPHACNRCSCSMLLFLAVQLWDLLHCGIRPTQRQFSGHMRQPLLAHQRIRLLLLLAAVWSPVHQTHSSGRAASASVCPGVSSAAWFLLFFFLKIGGSGWAGQRRSAGPVACPNGSQHTLLVSAAARHAELESETMWLSANTCPTRGAAGMMSAAHTAPRAHLKGWQVGNRERCQLVAAPHRQLL